MRHSHAFAASFPFIALALSAGAGTAQAQTAAAKPVTEAEAEAQRNYEIAVARAEAQRNYEIAVAVAEAERRKALALARGEAPPGAAREGAGARPSTDRALDRVIAPATGTAVDAGTRAQMAGTDGGSGADAQGDCDSAKLGAAAIVRTPNVYAQNCLGLTRWRDYAAAASDGYSSAGLNTTLTIGSANDVAEVIGTYSINQRTPLGTGSESYRFSRWRFRAGALVPVDKTGGTTAAFADLTQAQAFKRLGAMGGVEWRWGGVTKGAELEIKVAAMLAKAQKDCEAAAKEQGLAGDGQAERPDGGAANCRDAKLHAWMKADTARANGYWAMVADDLWGKKPTSEMFVGVEGRWVPYQLNYLPLRDPGMTGDTLLSGSPFDAAGDLIKANFKEFDRARYSVKMYAGGVEGNTGWAGSLTYRRIVDQPKEGKDVVLCPPSTANGVLCAAQQVARPYESEGWVIGGRMATKIQRFLFLPEIGMEMKLSYALDLKQIGFDAPIYLLSDKEGKASGGLRLGCTGDGKTPAGYEIKGECKASVFIGTNFTLRGAP